MIKKKLKKILHTSISMLAPLSNNSLMMSQCPCWHATWRAVWPSASSSICAERKESNPWPRQTFLNATKLKFDSRSFKKYPFSKRIFTKTWVTQFSSYAHISHIASILENCRDMLILSAGVEGMKEKKYPFWVSIQDFLKSWEVVTSRSIHEAGVLLFMSLT